MELMYVKFKNGDDIVCYILDELNTDTDIVTIQSPLQISIDPNQGFMVKEWLFLAQGTSITLRKDDIMFITLAGEKAADYYEQFHERIGSKRFKDGYDNEDDIDEDSVKEFEEIFSSMLESKTSTKH